MKLLEEIGKCWKMDKVMLTVFKGREQSAMYATVTIPFSSVLQTANTKAFKFYTRKLG